MSTGQRTGNRYCQRFGIEPPDLAAVAAHKEAKPFYLMIAALLAGGDRMTIDEIAERLRAAGVGAGWGDIRATLLRAWHGQDPVVRDADGRFALRLDSRWLDLILFIIGLRPARGSAPPPPPDVHLPDEHVPLTAVELDAAFRDRSLWSLSLLAQTAAVLEVEARPLSVGDVEAALAGLTRYRPRLGDETLRNWKDRCVTQGADGRLVLDRDSPALPAIRRAVRKLAVTVLRQRALDAYWKERQAEWKQRDADRAEREHRAAKALQRAVLRLLTIGDAPTALTILDCGDRTLRTFWGDRLGEGIAALAAYDLLAGLAIRDDLLRLGLDPDRWHLADLSPPQKTRRLNRRGRTLTLTAEMLIAATTRIGRPLGDPRRLARYAAGGDWARLRRRLEADAKALYAFYRYGCLHRCVRLRWGFLDETLGVGWAQPGDETAYELLREAGERELPVDVVLDTAPGWEQPWSRAFRATVERLSHYETFLRSTGQVRVVDLRDIQALRLTRDRPAERPMDWSPDSPCPCGSGQPYQACCLATLH